MRPLIVDVLSWVMAALKFLRVSQELLKIEPPLKGLMKWIETLQQLLAGHLLRTRCYQLGRNTVVYTTKWLSLWKFTLLREKYKSQIGITCYEEK